MDKIITTIEEDGTFTIGGMYRYMSEDTDYADNHGWSIIWHLNVPERVRCFIWLLKHERILTGQRMQDHSFGEARCNLCGNISETILHAMRDCKYAKEVRENRIENSIMHEFYTYDVQKWISLNLVAAFPREMDWSFYWAIDFHSIWEWRNIDLHDKKFVRLTNWWEIIFRKVQEYKEVGVVTKIVMECSKVEKHIRWFCLKPELVKLNVDGAHNVKGLSGCGGLICDKEGNWVGGLSKCVGRCSPLMAELWGIHDGLKMMVERGFVKVMVESDSKLVVDIVNKVKSHNLAMSNLVLQIHGYMELLEIVEIHHIYREANGCANLLAKHGKSVIGGCKSFQVKPNWILEAFEKDKSGFAYSRVVAV